jgi:xanthine dehydrogenase accessory factor
MRPENAVRLDPGPELLAERLKAVQGFCVVATIVSAAGSTYRKPGARMLIEADGYITGLLSGGCFEQDLREHATAVLSGGMAKTVTYDMRGDNDLIFGIGAGCEGRMDILLEPVFPGGIAARAILEACELSRRGESVALATIHEGPLDIIGTHLWRAGVPSPLGRNFDSACEQALKNERPQESRWPHLSGVVGALIQPLRPLPAILLCGAGPDAVPLVAALRALHFPVTITDHRPTYAHPDKFPGAEVICGAAGTVGARLDLTRFFAAVVMSHHLVSDVAYLTALANTSIAYVGVLGPRARRERVLTELGSAAAAIGGRLRGPVGLDIGAVTPEAIALAIAVEIYTAASGRHGGSLRSPPDRQVTGGRDALPVQFSARSFATLEGVKDEPLTP